ncbi:unnamed protein product [Chilo suppressalis]|uniref:t-SNARE coiled-coil homology domain-containing protein n=1 Tax=Chilo suppressalis TaxID=168631 RepID=A0ABN8B2C8_CHISP|nr:unnamed protein product [Chilo suppressalis]
MDITPLFKACIKTVKTRNKTFGIQSPISEDKQRILRTKPKSGFMTTAKDITCQITRLRDFLLEHREKYLSFFNNVTGDEMTESERDQIDTGAQRIINTCSHLLKEFRNDNRKHSVSHQMRDYMDGVIELIDMYLKAVCKIHSELKALRVKRALDIRKLTRLEQPQLKSSIPNPFVLETEKGKESDKEDDIPEMEETDNMKNRLDLTENEIAIISDENQLSAEELQMFESENVQLLNELNNMTEEVRQIESKVLHIAELQEIFTEKILQQEQDIDRISTTVVGATENVKDANEQIKQAIQRNAGLRVYILFFLLVMLCRYVRRISFTCRYPSIQANHFVISQIGFGSVKANKAMEAGKTMTVLGYAFTAEGQLRKLDPEGQLTDEPFQFNISDQHQECQVHYEELGNAVTNYIYHLLEVEHNLMRLPVPTDTNPGSGTFIFASKGYDVKDVLMILINGSGAVRAGQWARSLIINENLDKGTQIPYIKKAIAKDYGVMILNTNDNYQADGKKIKNSSNAEEHAKYVWDTYVAKAKASSIVIVAHSYGGVVTVTLADQLKYDFERQVKAIVFTDSVHAFSPIKMPKFMKDISRNWISSSAALDTPMKTPEFDCLRVSAGHPKHEMSSSACIDSAFKFIEEKLAGN